MKIYDFTRASSEHPDRDEDAILFFPGESDKASVFAVIDGMGGQQHENHDGTLMTGHEASQLVRDTLIEDLEHLPVDIDASPGGEAEQKVTAALIRAHQRVLRELNNGDEYPVGHRVGAVATVVVVCENGKRLLTVQVGDSRGYLFSDGELIQLCQDEDNIEYFVRSNLLTPEDAEKISLILDNYDGVDEPVTEGTITISGNPYDLYIAWRWFLVGNTVLNIPAANIVINALGIHSTDPVAQTSRIEVSPGDLLLLCSDGIYKNLAETEIITGLQQDGDKAKNLGDAAYARSQEKDNRRSTVDDISAVVVDLSANSDE